MNLRTIAKVTGWSLVAMAVIAGFSLGKVYDEVFSSVQSNEVGNFQLFQIVLFGILLTIILDLIVSFTLYKFFEKDNRVISLISAILRIIYTLIFAIAAISLASSWTIWMTNQIAVIANFERFSFIWTSGLIIFGFHLFFIGILMKIHKKIPTILWILTIIAGVSYSAIHFLKVITPSLEQFTNTIEMILMLPMIIGEVGLAIWLIIKGGKVIVVKTKTSKMKAAICTKYGAPEVLKIMEIEKPTPKDNDVLIKIMASAVNYGDTRVRRLDEKGILKIVMPFVLGFGKPRKPVLGASFSGIIEQTGKNANRFSVGDEVYGLSGWKMGTFAEYVTIPEKGMIAKKPSNATFEEAAALPFGAHTAIYFLEKAKIQEKANPKVLIYGATGAVGTAAIQIAKYHSAHVTAVCSEAGQKLVKELRVDAFILYDKENFTSRNEKFDIIFDAVGKISKKQCVNLLNSNGQYVTVAGLSPAVERVEQLELLRTLFENGKYQAVIDKTYPMDEIVEAHRYVDTGRKKGNVVLKIAE